MKVVLLGATGKAGSRILKELTARRHEVLAVARNFSNFAKTPGITAQQDDLTDTDRIAGLMHGADAAVSAYGPPPTDTDQLITVTARLIEAATRAECPRLVVVGGAASLEFAPGVKLYDSGHLPAEWKSIALSHIKTLELLKQSDIDWTYFSPAAFFEPGVRRGNFRLGTDQLIMDQQGESRISMEDYLCRAGG